MVLAQALQQCAIQSEIPPGMMCRAVQELHGCLAPLVEKGNLLDITMLDVAEKNPVTPSDATERASSLEQKPEPLEEETTALYTGSFGAQGSCLPRRISSCRGDCHQHPLDLVGHGQMSLTLLGDAASQVSIPPGDPADLSSLGSMQVIVS